MNRWLARLAAAATGLSCAVAVIYVTDGLAAHAVAWFLTALFAACWWVTQRSLNAAEERAERLETDSWVIRNAIADVDVLVKTLHADDPAEVRTFLADAENLLASALKRMNKEGAK